MVTTIIIAPGDNKPSIGKTSYGGLILIARLDPFINKELSSGRIAANIKTLPINIMESTAMAAT